MAPPVWHILWQHWQFTVKTSPHPIVTFLPFLPPPSLDQLRAERGDWQPLGRVGEAEDVAAAIAFLADNEAAAFVTGARLLVDGGQMLLSGKQASKGEALDSNLS